MCWVFLAGPAFSSCGSRTSYSGGLSHGDSWAPGGLPDAVLVVQGLSCPVAGQMAIGLSCPVTSQIFPGQDSNQCPLHWQADPSPLNRQGHSWERALDARMQIVPRAHLVTILLTLLGGGSWVACGFCRKHTFWLHANVQKVVFCIKENYNKIPG